MRITDAKLPEVGFTRVKGFIPVAELATAQAALWTVSPNPADDFADAPTCAVTAGPASAPGPTTRCGPQSPRAIRRWT